MVQPEHQERVGVRQDPLVDRQLVASLVDALEHGNGLSGDLAYNLLKVERGAVEQLESASYALEEVHLVPLSTLVGRPRDPPHLGHGREAVVQLRGVPVGFPRVAPGPVDAHSPLAAGVLAGDVVLVVGAPGKPQSSHIALRFSPGSAVRKRLSRRSAGNNPGMWIGSKTPCST